MWAKQQGIFQNPSWYPGLTHESSFQDFQVILHSIGHSNCARPCVSNSTSQSTQACHTAVQDEECFGHVTWAMQQGIFQNPSWYPGLTHESSFQDFQAILHSKGQGDCAQPCDSNSTSSQTAQACHTAVDGEDCFTAVMWAKQEGIHQEADWYPGLSPTSPFEAFQAHLHSINHGNCPEPCD